MEILGYIACGYFLVRIILDVIGMFRTKSSWTNIEYLSVEGRTKSGETLDMTKDGNILEVCIKDDEGNVVLNTKDFKKYE